MEEKDSYTSLAQASLAPLGTCRRVGMLARTIVERGGKSLTGEGPLVEEGAAEMLMGAGAPEEMAAEVVGVEAEEKLGLTVELRERLPAEVA